MAETSTSWQSRLVQVPVWALLAVGAALVGGGGALVMNPTAEASPKPETSDLADVRTILARIDGRLEGMERDGAALRSEMVSLRRDVNTLRADVDAIQRGH